MKSIIDQVPGKLGEEIVTAPAPTDAQVADGFVGETGGNEMMDRLGDMLRGEMSAVEAYDLALGRSKDRDMASTLRQLRDDHDRRVTLIRERLRMHHVDPAPTSGAWGTFARAVQKTADLMGDKVALQTLEQGEDHGLAMYRDNLDRLDVDTKRFVALELLPAQERSHDLCRSLLRYVKAA